MLSRMRIIELAKPQMDNLCSPLALRECKTCAGRRDSEGCSSEVFAEGQASETISLTSH